MERIIQSKFVFQLHVTLVEILFIYFVFFKLAFLLIKQVQQKNPFNRDMIYYKLQTSRYIKLDKLLSKF